MIQHRERSYNMPTKKLDHLKTINIGYHKEISTVLLATYINDLIVQVNNMSDVINSQSDAIFKMLQTQFKMLQTQENHNQTIAHLVAYSQKGKKLAE